MDATTNGTINIFRALRKSVPKKLRIESKDSPRKSDSGVAITPRMIAKTSAARICQCKGNRVIVLSIEQFPATLINKYY